MTCIAKLCYYSVIMVAEKVSRGSLGLQVRMSKGQFTVMTMNQA